MKDEGYGLRLIGHDTLQGFGGIGEGMSLQMTKDGRRILWLAHESAPKNFTGVDVTDPLKPKMVVQTELPHSACARTRSTSSATSWRWRYQTRRAGRSARRHRPLRHQRRPSSRSRSPSSTAPGRIRAARTACGSSTASTCTSPRRRRLPAAQPEGRPVLPIIDVRTRRSRAKSAAGGTRARAKATRSRRCRASEVRRRLSRRTTSTSIRSGPTAPTSATSTAAPSSSTSPTSRSRRSSSGWNYSPPINGFTHTVMPLFERDLLDRHRRMRQGRRRRLAEADVDRRRAQRDEPRADLDAAAAGRRSVPAAAGASARTTCTRTIPAPTSLRSDRPDRRHVLQRRRARLRHLEPVPAAGDRLLRPGGAARLARRRDPDQRRLRRRERDRLRGRPSAGGLYIVRARHLTLRDAR